MDAALKKYLLSGRSMTTWNHFDIFGSTWTPTTDPVLKGWKCKSLVGSTKGFAIFGQDNVVGCALVRMIGDGMEYQVAIYTTNPKDLQTAMLNNNSIVLSNQLVGHFKVPNITGWGILVMNAVELVRKGKEREIVLPCQ